MSTYVYFACIDHDPPIFAEGESGQHNETDAMRELLNNRDDWLDIADDERIEIVDRYACNGVQFFKQHPHCRLACQDEYDYWTDLGMGLPRGAKTHHPSGTETGQQEPRGGDGDSGAADDARGRQDEGERT